MGAGASVAGAAASEAGGSGRGVGGGGSDIGMAGAAGDGVGGSTMTAPRDPFEVVTNGAAVDIYVDTSDNPAVVRVVGDLRADVERVSGVLPSVKNSVAGLSPQAILVGTLGKSPVIDALVSAGKLDASVKAA